MDQFIELNINPAKVIALYPENVSGRLGIEKSGWVELFGGPVFVEKPAEAKHQREGAESETGKDKPVGGSSFKMGLGLGALIPGSSHGHGHTDDEKDTNSVHSVEQPQGPTGKKSKSKPGKTIVLFSLMRCSKMHIYRRNAAIDRISSSIFIFASS